MAWSPSAIYRVSHLRGWRVEELRISDAVMEEARKGHENYRQKICIAFREKVKKDTGRDPGWVEYDHLVIKKLRDVPAPIKKGTSMSKSTSRRDGRRAVTAVLTHSAHDDVGEGGCGCSCTGCDLNTRHCGNRSRGCKKG